MKLQHQFQKHQFQYSLDKYPKNAENHKLRNKYKIQKYFYKSFLFD